MTLCRGGVVEEGYEVSDDVLFEKSGNIGLICALTSKFIR